MSKQPEALRLANRLENGGEPDLPLLRAFAADVLRRQHALIAELVEAMETANEIAQTLESVIAEIDQSSSSYMLGSCYEAAKRLSKTWHATSAATLSKAKEQS